VTAVVVIGAEGFVGSAFAAYLAAQPGVDLSRVTRADYASLSGRHADIDVAIDCSGNSRKYVGDEQPADEFRLSVTQRLRTLLDFPARLQVHISSVDVYSTLDDPAANHEGAVIDVTRTSHYGFHKLLAEELVRHYAPDWLILRLGGMVGPRLRKNPVYDILEGRPLRIHPDSRYQFLATNDMARIAWSLVGRGLRREVVNICGDGLISPREIEALAGRGMDLSLVGRESRPRIVNISIERLRSLMAVPTTTAVVRSFLSLRP
jgi:nucleoside-diphosphate-sugar epimerase